ncbi:thioredoxin domain-containing protein 8-like isoform X2 [Pteropus medius]|uniref:thioredoxin domain-containing protein 8-like isoform X2 n=1 Tax=Pteropus vampyrus TaxID=132908 RepID=UPI00196BA9B6|nr:thioredoxin domain-containing protein 8-like isoform X2 [Pteropus giganteus]
MYISSFMFLSQDELKKFLKAAECKLVVVEFSAKWCGPCKKIYPIVHALSLQYQNVMFANVDVDDARELAQTCNIKAIPAFQMYKQTQKIFEFCGADAKKLETKIKELMLDILSMTFTWRSQQDSEDAHPGPPCGPGPSAKYQQGPIKPYQLPASHWMNELGHQRLFKNENPPT